MKRWVANTIRVALGIVVGLGVTEIAFRVRDAGAFPHLNTYVADAQLGARLRPGATEKIRFGSKANPVTSVRINRDGYRGEDWPAAARDEVIVVGDSQVFGLGVEEGDTFSAELARQLGAPVRNLGVPTYGPAEYNGVLAEQLEKRHGKTVIWVANIANDLFEASRPNRTRHVVEDGWAIRAETATHGRSFPGRALLYGQSHAVVALRRWLHPAPAEGFASEGTWRDIGIAANDAEGEHAKATAEAERLVSQHRTDLENAQRDVKTETARVERLVEKELTVEEKAKLGLVKVEAYDDDPNPAAESARSFRVTARHLRIGAEMRTRMVKLVRERAEETHDARLLDMFTKLDAANANAGRLAGALPEKPVSSSPLSASVREAKSICDRAGARLLVVALPMDVQVSSEEWKKYGSSPIDMTTSRVLNTDIVAAATAAGAEGYDAFDTLAAAEPGAFLDGDIHMTAKGHRALATGLAKAIAPH